MQIISLCSDSFTTWTTAFIKQAPFSTHRTLHETFGARRPSSVFFGNRFRSADCQKIQLPPGGSQGGLGEFVQSLAAPLWGWCSAQRIKIVMIAGGNHTSVSCREAAKGVPLVFLSCHHSTNHTPSVRPFGLPAPPPGSRGIVHIRPRFHKTITAYRTPQPLRRQLSFA